MYQNQEKNYSFDFLYEYISTREKAVDLTGLSGSEKAFIVSILLILNSIIGLFFYLYFLYDTSFYLDIILESLLLISGITFFIGVPLFLYSGIFLIIGKLRNKMK